MVTKLIAKTNLKIPPPQNRPASQHHTNKQKNKKTLTLTIIESTTILSLLKAFHRNVIDKKRVLP
jgi:hypothetical protein